MFYLSLCLKKLFAFRNKFDVELGFEVRHHLNGIDDKGLESRHHLNCVDERGTEKFYVHLNGNYMFIVSERGRASLLTSSSR